MTARTADPLELTRRAALARCLATRPATAIAVCEVGAAYAGSSRAIGSARHVAPVQLAHVLEFAGVGAMLLLFMAAAILA